MKKLLLLGLVLLLPTLVAADVYQGKPLYRLYNSNVKDSFYATNPSEVNSAILNAHYDLVGVEGLVLDTQAPGTIPLYEVYISAGTDHVLTSDTVELSNIQTTLGGTSVETLGYVFPAGSTGTVPLRRFYNSGVSDHCYAVDTACSPGYTEEASPGNVLRSPSSLPIYRMMSDALIDHLYEINAPVVTDDIRNGRHSAAYHLEGVIGWWPSGPGTTALYRFWSDTYTDTFYYTGDTTPPDYAPELVSGNAPAVYSSADSTAAAALTPPVTLVPLHLFWQSGPPANNADHLFTTDEGEKAALMGSSYAYSGITGYVEAVPSIDIATPVTTVTSTGGGTTPPTTYGCGAGCPVTPLPDELLVTNHSMCDVLAGHVAGIGGSHHYWCSPWGDWRVPDTDLIGETSESTPPVLTQCSTKNVWGFTYGTDILPSGCCTPGGCWNGTTFWDNQSADSRLIKYMPWPDQGATWMEGDHWRCVDNEWQDLTPKLSQDNMFLGFCPEDATTKRCLVTARDGSKGVTNLDMPVKMYENSNRPTCIKAGQFWDDYLCDQNGNWTTRTRMLALTMLSIVPPAASSYSIYCDLPGNVFDDASALGKQDGGVCTITGAKSTTDSCTNQFCLLKWREGTSTTVLAGTSLNTKITEEPTFLKVIDETLTKDSCVPSLSVGTDSFDQCGGAPNVWYNDKYQLVIYEPKGGMSGLVTVTNNEVATILAQKNVIIASTKALTKGLFDVSFFDQSNSMDIIYAADNMHGNQLFAFAQRRVVKEPQPTGEGIQTTVQVPEALAAIHYPVNGSIVCDFITGWAASPKNTKKTQKPIQCVYEPATNNTYIAQKNPGNDPAILDAWRDLTAKLRPR